MPTQQGSDRLPSSTATSVSQIFPSTVLLSNTYSPNWPQIGYLPAWGTGIIGMVPNIGDIYEVYIYIYVLYMSLRQSLYSWTSYVVQGVLQLPVLRWALGRTTGTHHWRVFLCPASQLIIMTQRPTMTAWPMTCSQFSLSKKPASTSCLAIDRLAFFTINTAMHFHAVHKYPTWHHRIN